MFHKEYLFLFLESHPIDSSEHWKLHLRAQVLHDQVYHHAQVLQLLLVYD